MTEKEEKFLFFVPSGLIIHHGSYLVNSLQRRLCRLKCRLGRSVFLMKEIFDLFGLLNGDGGLLIAKVHTVCSEESSHMTCSSINRMIK